MIYVALLRGINVGGNSTVPMPLLKKAFESLGFTDVSTYINSGNVIFKSKKKSPALLAKAVEKKIHKVFGFPVRALVRTGENIIKLARTIPRTWMNDKDQRTDVIFLWDKFDTKKTIGLIKTTDGVDTLRYILGAIVWNFKRVNYNKSSMHKFIGTEVYKHMTARNVNTVRKLASLLKG